MIVFLFTALYILWDTPQELANWNTSIAYVVVKLKIFKIFLYWFSIHEMAPIWNFLDPFSAKCCLILLKIWSELVSDTKNSIWKILQNLEFWLKWNAVNVYIFGPYWSPIYRRKTKNIAKNQKYCKNCTLVIINKVSPRSQKNHRIIVKFSQKILSGSKLGLDHHGSKGHHKFSHSL